MSAMSSLPTFLEPLGQGVYAVDTGFHRPRFDAAYLVVQNGRAAFIDTGTNHGVPRLLASLEALGLPRDAVDWVIPTHVHLDHAGGAGLLMRELPQAQMLVHPRGARHMIDPSVLWAGATAVYGAEEMARSYGDVVPVPAQRVLQSSDGLTIHLGDRPLLLIDTPGHAKHHHCIWDASSSGWFTGDTFGLSYREFDTALGAWIMPTSTPVQFEPEALHTSVTRLLAKQPRCMYVTHYGRVDDVARLGALLLDLLSQMVVLGRSAHHGAARPEDRHQALKHGQLDIFANSLAAHGCDFSRDKIADLLSIDLELNSQGMAVWLDRAS
jgi:glyoxylase-like metal-dependent hydrolase (beta-lactamase superfamily II)